MTTSELSNLKILIGIAKNELRLKSTKEEALQSLIFAGIKDKNNQFTPPYSLLTKYVKKNI